MSLTSFVVSRNWASSRLRILLTLVGIALGVAIVVAIYVMDHNTIQSRLQALDPERGWVDLEVLPTDATRDVAEVRRDLLAQERSEVFERYLEQLRAANAEAVEIYTQRVLLLGHV